MTDYAVDLAERLGDTHNFTRQHLKVASDRMKARYAQLANSAGFQEGDRMWLYCPIRRGKSPKLKTCTRINDVVYRVQRHPRAKMLVVLLDRLEPYLGATRDE